MINSQKGNKTINHVPTVSVPKAQTWRRQANNPWHKCCDTRAVASAVLRIHIDDEKQIVSLDEIIEWILGYVAQPFGCLGASDLQEAFLERSVKDVPDEVSGIVMVLLGEEVLIPQTEGTTVFYQLDRESVDALKVAQNDSEGSFTARPRQTENALS